VLLHGRHDAFRRAARQEGDGGTGRDGRGGIPLQAVLMDAGDDEPVGTGLRGVADVDDADRRDRHGGGVGGELTAAGLPGTHPEAELLPDDPLGHEQPVGVQDGEPHLGILLGTDPPAVLDDRRAQVVPQRRVVGDLARAAVA
jgi:hypothetical protein